MAKNEHFISVIVPVYNASQYLSDCIDSILAQAYCDLEIILVDDGSMDDSGAICDSYRKKDSRIRVIHQKNAGSVVARRNGLAVATGEYVGFVDADDYIEPDMYEVMLEIMEDTGADFVQVQTFHDKSEANEYDMIDLTDDNRAEVISEKIFQDISISSNLFTKLFRSQAIKSAFLDAPDEQQFGEDLLCLLSYLVKSKRICLCGKQLYHYREVEGSISHKSWDQMCVAASRLYECVHALLTKYGIWHKCKEAAESYYRSTLLCLLDQDDWERKLINHYVFGGIDAIRNKRIVLYGAGKVGADYYKQIVCNEKQGIVAWIDKNPVGSAVQSPNCLKELEYDYILIAVAKEEVAEEIRRSLLESGLCDDPSKIIWKEPERLW